MSVSETDRRQIEAVVADYVEGMVLADEPRLRRAFHPKACSIGHFGGALEWEQLDAFIAGVKAAFDPSSGVAPRWEIQDLEVTGDTALVRVEDDYVGYRFIDTLTLLRHDGRWQIVAKVFWVAGEV
ncbi:nuclear transport factor 2 family protein [Limibaculum sp. M0105]|uniref:Nuclear transport factor 2 family protein n=1 Tax=Thermohalobaculum xanthum TaxID=2753746 RepID=A0A8J7MAF2_9RHOB|nr:nuclear transport factor 2 family protein [Thermohalobaculum xanthum]MBK0400755.1 nuclear transport factor 2 family protein [Thermohalobaculum xanthum]